MWKTKDDDEGPSVIPISKKAVGIDEKLIYLTDWLILMPFPTEGKLWKKLSTFMNKKHGS